MFGVQETLPQVESPCHLDTFLLWCYISVHE